MPSESKAILLRRATLLLGDLEKALQRLADALGQPENEFVRDAAIQRFEFCFELAWKTIEATARLEGQDCPSPRTAFSTAWRNGWITDEGAWLDMLEERSKTSHTYREATAKEVFENLPGHLSHLNQLHRALVTRAGRSRSRSSSVRRRAEQAGRLKTVPYRCRKDANHKGHKEAKSPTRMPKGRFLACSVAFVIFVHFVVQEFFRPPRSAPFVVRSIAAMIWVPRGLSVRASRR